MKYFNILIMTVVFLSTSPMLYSELTILTDSVKLADNSKLNLGGNCRIGDIDSFNNNILTITGNYHLIGGFVIKSTDGGDTWNNLFIDDFSQSYGKDSTKEDKDYYLRHSCILDNKTLVTADAFGRKFFKTIDNGQTWDTIPGSIIDTSVFIYNFEMFDHDFGYIVTGSFASEPGFDYAVYFTKNGCKNWERVNFDLSFVDRDRYVPVLNGAKIINNKVYALYFLAKKNNKLDYDNVIVTYNLISKENGVIEIPKYTNDFYFLTENEGIVLGNMFPPIKFNMDTALVHKTYDGGKTWELVYKGNEKFKEALNLFYFSSNMIAINGKGTKLLISKNRGNNWEDIADTNKLVEIVAPMDIASENTIYFFQYDRLYKWVDDETSIVELPKVSDFIVFPNPVQDVLKINNNKKGLYQNIEIYNVLSEKVLTANISENNSINVSHLAPGVYFIKIGDKVQKFVKE